MLLLKPALKQVQYMSIYVLSFIFIRNGLAISGIVAIKVEFLMLYPCVLDRSRN